MKNLLAALLVLIGLSAPAAATSLYTSDNSTTGFDATTAATLPTEWANKTGTFVVNTHTPLTGHTHTLWDSGANTAGDVALATSVTSAADMEVSTVTSVDAVVGTNPSSMGIIARSDAINSNHYLCFLFDTTHLTLYKKVGGAYTQLGTYLIAVTITAGHNYGLKLRTVGTSITCKIWDTTGAEGTSYQASATDAAVATAGFAGIYVATATPGTPVVSDYTVDSISSATDNLVVLGNTVSGASVTLNGQYNGVAPAALDYSIDGGAYAAASTPTIAGGAFSFSVTSPATGFHTVDVREHTTTAETAAAPYSFASVPVTINPNDASIVYSPYNWNVSVSHAITINSGAYFRMLFTGTSVVLNFNVAAMASPASEIWWRVDRYGPWTQANVAATVTPTISAALLSKTNIPYHLLEVMVKSTTYGANRWNTGVTTTAVDMTSITLDSGALVATPKKAPRNVLLYGDSITEGILTLAESAANDVDRGDAKLSATGFPIGELLGAEVGVVGFGGQGYVTVGTVATNVPTFPNSYNLLYQGISRTFSPTPDLVVIEEGTNDGATNTTTAATGVFNNIISAVGTSVPIAVLRPLNGTAQSAFLTAAIAASSHPSQLHFIDTAGFFNTSFGADSGTLHPSGPNAVGLVAPQIAAQLKTLLTGAPAGVITGMLQAPW